MRKVSATEAGLAGGHLRLAGRNQAGLLREFALGLQALGLAGCKGGVGAVDGQVEIITFEFDQQLAFFNVLVVLYQNLIDARTELARHASDLALHIGVVGALVKAPFEKPVSKKCPGDEQDEQQENKQATLELGRHGANCSRGIVRKVISRQIWHTADKR